MMQARRIILIASLLAAGFALSGCESFDPESWFNPKKPLPGERKAMFPGGVPGVPQGVPPELMKGYQPAPDIPPEAANQEAPKPRFVAPERKTAPKPKQQAAAPPDIPPEAATQEAPAPRFVPPERKPAPKPKQAAAPKPAPSQAQSQPQEQSAPPPQAAPWPPQPSSQSNSPFPPPPGR